MYKLFIADDEAIIREGLRCLLDWETLGFTIAGEAANGDAALQFLLSETPDLVLLDIRMPGMSGLDVVRIAREHGYDGKVVILSGYSRISITPEQPYATAYSPISPSPSTKMSFSRLSPADTESAGFRCQRPGFFCALPAESIRFHHPGSACRHCRLRPPGSCGAASECGYISGNHLRKIQPPHGGRGLPLFRPAARDQPGSQFL